VPDIKNSSITKEGFILPVKSDMETVNYALASKEKDKYTPIYYLRSSKVNLKNWETRKSKSQAMNLQFLAGIIPSFDVETVIPSY